MFINLKGDKFFYFYLFVVGNKGGGGGGGEGVLFINLRKD